MQLTIIFDQDLHGSHGDFERGDLVDLVFRIDPEIVRLVPEREALFESRDDASCSLVGSVAWLAPPSESTKRLAAIHAGAFSCYIEDYQVGDWQLGTTIVVEGTLYRDDYTWQHLIKDRNPEAPNLLYSLKVTRLRECLVASRPPC